MIFFIVRNPSTDAMAGISSFPFMVEFSRPETKVYKDRKDEIVAWGRALYGGIYPPFGGGYYRNWGLSAHGSKWKAYFKTELDAFKFKLRWDLGV